MSDRLVGYSFFCCSLPDYEFEDVLWMESTTMDQNKLTLMVK